MPHELLVRDAAIFTNSADKDSFLGEFNARVFRPGDESSLARLASEFRVSPEEISHLNYRAWTMGRSLSPRRKSIDSAEIARVVGGTKLSLINDAPSV